MEPLPHARRKVLDKLASHLIGVQACQLTGGGHVEIVQHPACHGGVEHHEQIAANEGEVAVDVPLLARLFQCLIGPHRAFAGSAAHRKLHGHDGQAQNDEEDYFLHYMLQKVLHLNLTNLDTSLSTNQQFYQLLLYLFPKYL